MVTKDIPVLIPRRRVCELTGLARSALYDRIQRHEFPAPVHVGSSAVRWIQGEVVQWIEAQIDASRKPVARKVSTRRTTPASREGD